MSGIGGTDLDARDPSDRRPFQMHGATSARTSGTASHGNSA
jgi:hypothetical protein